MKLSTPMPGRGVTEFAWGVLAGREGGGGNHMGWAQDHISLSLKLLSIEKQALETDALENQ